MPQLAPIFAAGVAGIASNTAAALGFSVAAQAGIAASAATVGSIIGGVALPIGLSLAASALFRPDTPKPSDGQQEIQQPIPVRVWHYGRVKVSGPLLFYESRAQAGRPHLWKIVALAARQTDAFEALYLNDKEVTLDVNGWVTESQYIHESVPRVRIVTHLGTDTQAYDSILGAEFPEWTSAHRLRGITYAMLELADAGVEVFNEVYPNGEPSFSALLRSALLYDPREGGHDPDDKTTWEWSDNAGLAVLDWLIQADGYGLSLSQIDAPSFEDHADLCDELVDLAAGGTEPRYRIATSVSLAERRTDVLNRLREASDARIYQGPTGLVGIRGGKWTSPPVSIVMGAETEVQISDGEDALNRYNELAVRYMSPDHGYTEVEGEPWRDETAITEAGGKVVTRPLDLLNVPSHGQARRIAKIIMARDNPKWIGQLRTNFAGLDLINQEAVDLSWAEMNEPEGEFDGMFWVGPGMSVAADGTGMMLPIRSADPDAYEWDEDTEEGEAPPVPEELT